MGKGWRLMDLDKKRDVIAVSERSCRRVEVTKYEDILAGRECQFIQIMRCSNAKIA